MTCCYKKNYVRLFIMSHIFFFFFFPPRHVYHNIIFVSMVQTSLHASSFLVSFLHCTSLNHCILVLEKVCIQLHPCACVLCRCGEHSVAHTFLGSDMVQWLQTVGLASDQGEALLYGSRLLEGGVIHHITHDYSFQDDNLHYCFTQGSVVHR